MKKRLRIFLLTCFILFAFSALFPVKSFSQHVAFEAGATKWEVGINMGPSFFLGDLGGNAGKGTRFIKDVNLEFTEIVKGFFVSAYPNDWLGFRFTAQTGSLKGEDNIINTHGVDELWRKQRNLDFRSTLHEAYVVAEFFPFMYLRRNDDEDFAPRLRPYGVAGIGIFHFNPQGSITDANGNKTWHYLKPLRTEGQGMAEYPNRRQYSLTQPNMPLGAGLKYFISNRLNVSFELLLRKSFTDYIDDVSTEYIDPNLFDKYLSPGDDIIARSIHDKTYGIVTPGVTRYEPGTQRGNPRQNDSYFSLLMKIGVRIGTIYENGFGRTQRAQLRCPERF
jgi:hypothetical protein